MKYFRPVIHLSSTDKNKNLIFLILEMALLRTSAADNTVQIEGNFGSVRGWKNGLGGARCGVRLGIKQLQLLKLQLLELQLLELQLLELQLLELQLLKNISNIF